MLNVNVGWRKVSIDVAGEAITAEVRPLKQGHSLEVAPIAEDSVTSYTAKAIAIVSYMRDKFGDYIRNVDGVQIDGKPCTNDDLLQEAPLFEVALKLIQEVLDCSRIKGADEGNSGGQSEQVNTEL